MILAQTDYHQEIAFWVLDSLKYKKLDFLAIYSIIQPSEWMRFTENEWNHLEWDGFSNIDFNHLFHFGI